MVFRRAVAVLTLAGTTSVMIWACSSSDKRDQNYGKDVATTYIPPEAGAREVGAPRDAGSDATTDAGTEDQAHDSSDAIGDAAQGG
jgi:hypothetical protein